MAIVDRAARRMFPVGRAVVKLPAAKEPIDYLMANDGDELDEAIAITRQRVSAHRQRGEAVPAALTVEVERLIESRRIRGDQNFEGGRNQTWER